MPFVGDWGFEKTMDLDITIIETAGQILVIRYLQNREVELFVNVCQ